MELNRTELIISLCPVLFANNGDYQCPLNPFKHTNVEEGWLIKIYFHRQQKHKAQLTKLVYMKQSSKTIKQAELNQLHKRNQKPPEADIPPRSMFRYLQMHPKKVLKKKVFFSKKIASWHRSLLVSQFQLGGFQVLKRELVNGYYK